MNTEQILDYNKKCAEFLKWEVAGPGFTAGYWNGKDFIQFHELKFHTDWNWIMEVVEGIEKEKCNFTIHTQWNEFNEENYTQVTVNKREGEMSRNRTAIYNSVDVYNHHSPTVTSKKEAVIHSIERFLHWYNSNN